MRLKPSSPLTWFAILALLTGGGLVYSLTREGPLTAGALQVTPSKLTLRSAQPATLSVTNVGPTAITVEAQAEGVQPRIVLADPAEAVVRPGATVALEIRQVGMRDGTLTMEEDPVVVVSAGTDTVRVPLTIEGDAAPPHGAGALRIDEPAVRFDRGVSAVTRTIVNAGTSTLRWSAAPPSWLRMRSSGTLERGRSTVVRLEVDRSTLPVGETTHRVPVTSDAGDGAFDVTVITTADPVLSLPSPKLDFGVGGRLTVKTLTFEVRNAGRGVLRYQASVDRVFLRLGEGASGALDPGESAQVQLTFDYKETRTSYDWVAQVPVSSNGGSAVLGVEGVSDWDGPKLLRGSNQMDTVHDHCSGGSCERYRHLRATVEDPRKVILVEAAFQICTGSEPDTAACDGWRMAPKGRRISGTALKGTYQIDIGPLPKTCVPGVAVVVQYRFRLADSLKNSVLRPGGSTHYGHPHCSRAD